MSGDGTSGVPRGRRHCSKSLPVRIAPVAPGLTLTTGPFLAVGTTIGPAAPVVRKGQVQPVAVQQWGRVHAVHDPELAVAVLGVELPDLLALEVKAGDVPGGDEGVNVRAVRAGGGGRFIALVPPEHPAA